MCGAPGGSASSALTATATASAEGLERGMLRSGFQQPLLRSRRGSKPVLLQRRDKIALDSGRATVDEEIAALRAVHPSPRTRADFMGKKLPSCHAFAPMLPLRRNRFNKTIPVSHLRLPRHRRLRMSRSYAILEGPRVGSGGTTGPVTAGALRDGA